jgi:hypothetical protein
MRCPNCGAENAATRRFCAQCGAALPSPCPACGFENEPTAKFCGGCGRPVGELAIQVPVAGPALSRGDGAERRSFSIGATGWFARVAGAGRSTWWSAGLGGGDRPAGIYGGALRMR